MKEHINSLSKKSCPIIILGVKPFSFFMLLSIIEFTEPVLDNPWYLLSVVLNLETFSGFPFNGHSYRNL